MTQSHHVNHSSQTPCATFAGEIIGQCREMPYASPTTAAQSVHPDLMALRVREHPQSDFGQAKRIASIRTTLEVGTQLEARPHKPD
jgi:hypothetical protein